VEKSDKSDSEKVPTADSRIIEMAGTVLSGSIFPTPGPDGTLDVTAIVEFRKKFGDYLEGLKGVAKSFDEQLVMLRQVNGSDYLSDVPHFRKPREDKKEGNSLLDKLRL